jgi:DNA-binding NarL/FixJ family response regulator
MVRRIPISVALAEFEDLVALGLKSLIEDDESLELVAGGVPTTLLADTLASLKPEVAVLNYGKLGSVADVRHLYANFPHTRLLVLANHPTAAESRQMLAFGATACLAKSTQGRDVLNAIHLASRGLQLLPPTGARPAIDAPTGPELLTPREAEVLDELHSGQSNAEIAHTLNVSVETVRTHAQRIYRKLGVKSRRELRLRR